MKPRTLFLLGLALIFVVGLGWALLREVRREEAVLARSISGVVEVAPPLYAQGLADVVRTDRLVLLLVEPASGRTVAMRFESPLVPPQTIRIGPEDAREGQALSGSYLVVGITDKDGEIFKVTPGEVYGRSPQPVALGTEQYHLLLDQPFRGSLFNEPRAASAGTPGPAAAGPALGSEEGDPRFSIAGTIVVTPAHQGNVARSDRLVILLFDPQQGRPVAFKIVPHALLPQRFAIALPPEARGSAQPAYSLRVLTDKNNDPFGSAPGELIGRSRELIPLGTQDLVFTLDTPYTR